MIALLALLLIQDRPVEAAIDAFLKGEESARSELVKHGAFAIRPLQKARGKGPEKIDALVYELKKAAAYPKDPEFLLFLEVKTTAKGEVEFFKHPDEPVIIWNELRAEIKAPLFLQTVTAAELKSTRAAIDVKDRPARAILDQVCESTGLDYGYFHDAIVLGLADRLWPPGPRPKPRALTGVEAAAARKWIEKLNSESIADRESAAAELMKLGPGVSSLLEGAFDRPEKELAARCKSLFKALNRAPRTPFGPPAAALQEATPEIETVRKGLRDEFMETVLLNETTAKEMAGFLVGEKGFKFKFAADPAKDWRIASIDVRSRVSAFELWAMVAQLAGLDFAIVNGVVVIDTPDRIERLLTEGK